MSNNKYVQCVMIYSDDYKLPTKNVYIILDTVQKDADF